MKGRQKIRLYDNQTGKQRVIFRIVYSINGNGYIRFNSAKVKVGYDSQMHIWVGFTDLQITEAK